MTSRAGPGGRGPVRLVEADVVGPSPVGEHSLLREEAVVAALLAALMGEVRRALAPPPRLVVVIRHRGAWGGRAANGEKMKRAQGDGGCIKRGERGERERARERYRAREREREREREKVVNYEEGKGRRNGKDQNGGVTHSQKESMLRTFPQFV